MNIRNVTNLIKGKEGVARLIVIMIIVIIVLAFPIGYAIWNNFKNEVENSECRIAVEAAQKKLDTEYLHNPDMTYEEAVEAATSSVRGLDDICPAHNECIIEKDSDGEGYKIYCSVHGSMDE